jgi:multiple sugar transport system substrate-binding protein
VREKMRVFAALAACFWIGTFGFAKAQQVTISYWNFFTGGDGGRMTELVNNFNKSQDKIKVEAATLQWGVPFYTKTRAAILSGNAPDMFSFHLSKMPDWGSSDLLRPITEQELESVGLKESDFAPHAWDQAHVNGKLYAVPLDTHTLVLYVNLSLAKKAGLLDENGKLKPINSMDDFMADMRAIHSKTGASGVEFGSDATAADPWRVWYTLVKQQNADVVSSSDGKAAFGDAGKVALSTMASWVKEGLMIGKLDQPTAPAVFVSGRSGFLLGGDWNRPTLADAQAKHQLSFDYEIIPVPKFFQAARSWADSHSFAMPGKSNQLSPEKLAAVLQFIAYVEKHALIWAEGGHIPSYLPVTDSSAYKDMVPNNEYAGAAEEVAYDPDIWFAGVAGPLYQLAARYLNSGMNGQMPVDQAISEFARGINQIQH